jgi:UDP-glucose 4-epimerase
MNCLVTGGKGFIGSHIVERLLSEGHEVKVIDDESATENEEFYVFEGAEYHKLDICSPKSHDLYQGVDVVFHLAARSRIQPAFNDIADTFSNNVMGTQSVIEACLKGGVKRVVYSGSSSVYGHNPPPHDETMLTDCLNPYSVSKWQGEQICKLYAKMSDLECVALRYFNVYGPREPLKGSYAPVIGLFKRQKNEPRRKFTIIGSGNQRRDFTHIYDVVDANMLAGLLDSKALFRKTGHLTTLERKNSSVTKFEIFNIGTGVNYSINDVANLIDAEFGRIHLPPRRGEVQVTLADNSKARDILGWEPSRVLEEMIMSY